MAKRTRKGDALIVADGGSEEAEVAAWWDALDAKEKAVIARKCGADYEPIDKWDDMIPIGQQMRIHMWYDEHGRGGGGQVELEDAAKRK